jgi:surfactin synthase thioesterase subunit
LIGHSLGAIKSIIYQGTRRRSDIAGIVSCSAPRQFYSERIARQPKFRELIEQAESMVAGGKGEELMSVAVGATPGIFSARTHLDKYGKDDRNDCRSHAKNLGCPLLAVVGGAEPNLFHEYAQEIVANAGANATYERVDGGNHFYSRHTAQIVEVINQWLARLAD